MNYEILQLEQVISNKNNDDKQLAKIKFLENQNLKVNNEFIKAHTIMIEFPQE